MHQKDQRLDFDEITKLVNLPLKKGDTWYLLDKKWFDMCKAYHETGDKSVYPGPINNEALLVPSSNEGNKISSNGFNVSETASLTEEDGKKFKSPLAEAAPLDRRPLKSGISESEGDFIFVPEKCWNLLKDCFGIVNPDHAVKRQVISDNGVEIIELNFIKLKICLYGAKEANVERLFSRSTTLYQLQSEMRKLFNIPSDRESKLWLNNTIYPWEPVSGVTASKSENNIQSNSSSPSSQSPKPLQPVSTNTNSSPNVVTRLAANSMNKQPIALPDASTSNKLGSSILSNSTSDSPIGSSAGTTSPVSKTKDAQDQTLGSVGVSETAIATLEVINADGTWPGSRPRHGTVATRSSKAQPGLCGLANMGNTCFMNAALQCLSNTPPLTNYILTEKFLDDINTNNPLGMHGEIARTYAEVIKLMWSGNHSSIVPREFKCAVSRFAPQFNGFAQQDCQELMAFLLDGLHEDLNRIRNKPYIETKNETESRPDDVVAEESWENYKKRNDSIVVDTFHAMLKSTLVCPGCQLVSVTFDPFCYLSLPLPVKREKQVNLTFIPKPSKIDESKLLTVFEKLDPEEVKSIKQYGGSISSFSGVFGEHGCYTNPKSWSKSCKMQVPRSGPVSEICDIVSRIINEENSGQPCEKVKPNNLVVAELSSDGRISKIYESNEHYNQMSDDVVVVEKGSTYVIPLYLRERKAKNSIAGSVIAKPLFLHVPDLKFKTLYLSTLTSLSNLTAELHDELQSNNELLSEWIKLTPPGINLVSKGCDAMDCDDDNDSVDRSSDTIANSNGDCPSAESMDTSPLISTTGANDSSKLNGGPIRKDLSASSVASSSSNNNDNVSFELCIVNSFGNHSIETLNPGRKDCDYDTKLYLGATFSPAALSLPQFIHLRQSKFCDFVETFNPKVLPKPTLQLKDCITQFTTVERLGADDPWYCPKCKKHQQATKKFDIWSLPKVLIIYLKRFSFSRSWRDKIDTLVEFPVENLDMSNYVLSPQQKKHGASYNLIGVANHFGGLGGGHYTAYAKNAIQNAWYSFDDVNVTPTSSSNVVTRSAYVLFYQLQEDGQA